MDHFTFALKCIAFISYFVSHHLCLLGCTCLWLSVHILQVECVPKTLPTTIGSEKRKKDKLKLDISTFGQYTLRKLSWPISWTYKAGSNTMQQKNQPDIFESSQVGFVGWIWKDEEREANQTDPLLGCRY
jgi:hypothetical protein